MEKPVIGIPIGDPAGIGPEIVLKALKNEGLYQGSKPLVVGSMAVLERMEGLLGTGLRLKSRTEPEEAAFQYGTVDVIDLDNVNLEGEGLEFGKVQAAAGRAAYEYIVKTVELALAGKVCAIATTPINKEAIRAAAIDFIGHTEMLAGMTQTQDPLTMFQVDSLRVFFLSRHVSLHKACEMVKADRIEDYLERCDQAMKMLGLGRRKLAVAGLNPHSGEHGLFGDEEVREVEPAVIRARNAGIDVTGPVAADSVFHQALKGRYDAVLSLYHDQGHIATKMVDFERTISLTIGLPFLRTSVDHGTAFDIAGKGIAGSVSMEEAIRLAALYGPSYRQV